MQFPTHDEDEIPEDTFNRPDEDDIEINEPTDFDDDDLNEENYRTTFNLSDGLDEDAEGLEIADEE